MSWARDEVLFRAQFAILGLKAVQNRVYREQPDRPPEAVHQATVTLVRSLVGDGLVVLGDRTERGFVAWSDALEERIDRIEASFSTTGTANSTELPSLRLTEEGRRAAASVPVDVGDEKPDDAPRQWDWRFPDAAAELLVYGTTDWIELGQVHWRISEVSSGEPLGVLQQRTLEMIADLVRGGLAHLGAFEPDAPGFVPWECSLDEALDRIRSVYVDGYDDEFTWEWFCLLELTRRGAVLAGAIEAQTAR